MHHSELKAGHGDAVIIGASKLEHFNQNVECCIKQGLLFYHLGKTPLKLTGLESDAKLPKSLIDAFDAAWNLTKGDCPLYFRTTN